MTTNASNSNEIPFKAETQQVLDILIHSLYQDREVFLRELLSNASDALTRLEFEQLTNRNILNPDAELAIWIKPDPENNQLTISDSGIGMSADEMVSNLGTIAHSGAKAFIEAAQKEKAPVTDIIGQFGVGFYSVFMIADSVKVVSRSFNPNLQASTWVSQGKNTFSLETGEKESRGTEIIINLKSDAAEFAQKFTIENIVKKHSDFIPYPIYLIDGEEHKQINQQTALWRQQPHTIEEKKYQEFYKQFSLEIDPPLTHTHISVDAPVQMYALLFTPGNKDKNVFSTRKQDGLKLYARKILIQDYCQDLLPEFLRFVQGVVDSEDIPLNVSRETIQSSRVIQQLKKIVTSKYLESLKSLSVEKPEDYEKFWNVYGQFIKEGLAIDQEYFDNLLPLLRFYTLKEPQKLSSLDDYVNGFKLKQEKIYYIVGEDPKSILKSPHLELFKQHEYDVILLSDPIDAFMLLKLTTYQEHEFINVTNENLDLPELEKEEDKKEKDNEEVENGDLLKYIKELLGEKIEEVRTTSRLVESPARLVDKQGSNFSELQRVYKLLDKEFEVPQKVLEINPKHEIIQKLREMEPSNPLKSVITEQVYENALLSEGLHPDPVSMIERIQKIIQAALN